MNNRSENPVRFIIEIAQDIVTSWQNNQRPKYPKKLHNIGTNEVINMK